jgi:nucleotide-binding universal stress UspA family protein
MSVRSVPAKEPIMFDHLVVPVDRSSASFDAIPVAAKMAASVGGRVEVITVVDRLADVARAREAMTRGIERLGSLSLEPEQLVHASNSVVGAITRHIENSQGGMLVMSAHGHGRSAAVLGSTSDEILRAIFGPVIMVGPHVGDAAGELDGTYVVPIDGSTRADGVLPIVAAWTTEFGGTPWLVEVVEESILDGGDFVGSSFVSVRASELRRRIDRQVQFEVLYGRSPARSIVEFAKNERASLIFLATHGRTGFERLRSGSVAADVLRHAECPVVMFRPPELATDRSFVSSGAAIRY